jgi:hypothetical protein
MALYFRPVLEAISKSGFWLKVKAAVRIKPEEYIRYFEDLIRALNAEIGPKDLFEIASNKRATLVQVKLPEAPPALSFGRP